MGCSELIFVCTKTCQIPRAVCLKYLPTWPPYQAIDRNHREQLHGTLAPIDSSYRDHLRSDIPRISFVSLDAESVG